MLEDTLKALEKKFGKGTICIASQMLGTTLERESTGSLALDIETGGGFPKGRVVEIYGDEASGKTSLALLTVAEMQRKSGKVVWVDAEGTLDRPWAKTLGVDLDKLYLSVPETGEIACDVLDSVVRSGDCSLAVLDSVAALIPVSDVEKSMVDDPERLGERAMMVNRLVRKLQSALNIRTGEDRLPNNCIVIFINQIREAIGIYGNPEFTPGGRGKDLSYSIRLHIRRGDWIELGKGNEKERIGYTVKFRTTKNKTYPPHRVGEFDFYFKGDKAGKIDKTKEVMIYSILYGLIEQAGAFYTIGEEKIQGKETVKTYLDSKPELVEKLKKDLCSIIFKESGVK